MSMYDDLEPENAAERQLIEAAAEGQDADYQTGEKDADDPAKGADWDEERTIRGEIICALLTGDDEKWPITHRGVEIWGARVTGKIDLDFADVKVPLGLQYCYVERPINLVHARIIALNLAGTHVPGLNADGLKTSASVFLRSGFTATGEVRLVGAEIEGELSCDGGIFENPATAENPEARALNGDSLTVEGNVFLGDGFSAAGEVRLVGAGIGGQLNCRRGTFENPKGAALRAERLTVKGTVLLDDGFSVEGILDFQHAKSGPLADEKNCWPKPGQLRLDGFVYDAFAGKFRVTATDRLEWLELQPNRPFRPQPYEQLVKVLRQMGHESDAREIAIAKQEALRERGDLSGPAKFWNWVLGRLIGHGYRPWKVLPHIAVMLALGFITFSIADQNAMMRPAKERVYMNPCFAELTKECMRDGWVQIPKLLYLRPGVRLWGPGINLPADYPRFHPGLYSADVFFPFVDLHQESYWLPRAEESGENFYRIYMWLHILLGWVLTSIGVVGLTGIVKKD